MFILVLSTNLMAIYTVTGCESRDSVDDKGCNFI